MSELVIFHKQLGDTVLLEPVLRKLAAASGGQVELLCPRQFAPVIELMPHTRLAAGRGRWFPDRLWAYDWGGKTTRAAALTFCREKHLLIPNADYAVGWRRRVFSAVNVEAYAGRYVAQYLWDHTPVAGTSAFAPPLLAPPPQGWMPSGYTPDPYILLNPVSAWKRKSYEPGKWVEVLAQVSDRGFSRVVLTGGTDDWQREHCALITEGAVKNGIQVEDFTGRTTLREFLFLIAHAAAVLCVDGAAAHVARAFQVPCVTLFGPSYRWLWHLDGDPRYAAIGGMEKYEAERPSVGHIATDRVFEALSGVLAAV